MMNIRFLFLSFIMSACGSKMALQEQYDSVTITSYNNIYDNENKLLETKAINTLYVYGVTTIRKVDEYSTCRYKYIEDNGVIIETRFGFSDEIEVFKRVKDTEETWCVDSNKDTTRYSLLRYFDDSMTKLAYFRKVDFKTVTRDGIVHDNYEEAYFYNRDGIDMTKVRYDFNTKKKFITYQFDKLPYNEAVKLIPRTTDEYEIICYTQRNEKDTVVNILSVNGAPATTEKTIVEKGKKQVFRFNDEMKLVSTTTEFKEGGATIEVYNSALKNWTDSTYYKNGKEIRSVNISDEFEFVTTYKYDEKGNVIEKVAKTKDLEAKTDKEVINDMLEILRKSNANKE